MVAWGDADQADDYNMMTKQDFLNLAATGANVVHLSVAGIWKIKSPYEVRQTKQDELDHGRDAQEEHHPLVAKGLLKLFEDDRF